MFKKHEGRARSFGINTSTRRGLRRQALFRCPHGLTRASAARPYSDLFLQLLFGFYISIFSASRALASMNSRRGST